MSTTDSRQVTTNPHIATLQSMLATCVTPPEWLIISHDDENLSRELLAASGGRPAALLAIPQDNWDDQLLKDAVSWVLQHIGIGDIVLAGHSRTGPVPKELLPKKILPGEMHPTGRLAKNELASHRQCEPTGGYQRLADGARQFSLEIEKAHQRFADQADRLLTTPAVQQRLEAGVLCVHTLLYRADSGLFFAYCADRGDFVPLG